MLELNRLLQDRFNEIWINGRFVASINRFNYCLMLYSLDNRYVELIYDKSCGKIVWLSFTEEADLEKYLQEIEIPFHPSTE